MLPDDARRARARSCHAHTCHAAMPRGRACPCLDGARAHDMRATCLFHISCSPAAACLSSACTCLAFCSAPALFMMPPPPPRPPVLARSQPPSPSRRHAAAARPPRFPRSSCRLTSSPARLPPVHLPSSVRRSCHSSIVCLHRDPRCTSCTSSPFALPSPFHFPSASGRRAAAAAGTGLRFLQVARWKARRKKNARLARGGDPKSISTEYAA